MQATIHVSYLVELFEDDAEKIDMGDISPEDIDWTLYIDEKATERELDYVDIF